MDSGTQPQVSLYDEAKAGLYSLMKQTSAVFLGIILMLLITGGAPSGFTLGMSVFFGTTCIAWHEQKRLRKLRPIRNSFSVQVSQPKTQVVESSIQKNYLLGNAIEFQITIQHEQATEEDLMEILIMVAAELKNQSAIVDLDFPWNNHQKTYRSEFLDVKIPGKKLTGFGVWLYEYLAGTKTKFILAYRGKTLELEGNREPSLAQFLKELEDFSSSILRSQVVEILSEQGLF